MYQGFEFGFSFDLNGLFVNVWLAVLLKTSLILFVISSISCYVQRSRACIFSKSFIIVVSRPWLLWTVLTNSFLLLSNHCVFVGCCDVLLLFMFGVTDVCKVMCIGLCTSDSKGSKPCISNSFTKENNFDDIKK